MRWFHNRPPLIDPRRVRHDHRTLPGDGTTNPSLLRPPPRATSDSRSSARPSTPRLALEDWSRRDVLLAGLTAVTGALFAGPSWTGTEAESPPQILWVFDRWGDVGGVPTRVEGSPKLIESPWGGAIEFDGVDDALFIDQHPLAGAATFTFEALFRPDGGDFEQRWFHLAQEAPDPGAEPDIATSSRILFEIRVVEDAWYLDSFIRGPSHRHTLVSPDRLHPIGRWAHVAQTYDGESYRSYVNGVLQDEAKVTYTPQGHGRSSVGTRINRVDYFRGAVREARFTSRALAPSDFTNPL